MILAGKVLVSGAIADNPARQVEASEPLKIAGPKPKYVSRGGFKLEGALQTFDLDVRARHCLDVGASTGGFTDCLLQSGASDVVALDVGHGQLHEKIRADPRVRVLERTNIRHVTKEKLGGVPFDIVTVDVSFISLKTIADVITGDLVRPGADIVTLVKPQFEAGKSEVSKGKGVVSGATIWTRVLSDVVDAMSERSAATMGLMLSPLLGAEGNVEFLAWWRAHTAADSREPVVEPTRSDTAAMIDAVVADAEKRIESLESSS